jgi:RNA polymerase sigma factor (sigma-70 family)
MGQNQQLSDRALLERAAEGDENALGELYERHGARCLRRARAVLRNAALAEDAVQEAFLDLWRTAGRFDERRADVLVWLLVLVHRRSVDLARREARRHAFDASLPVPRDSSYTAEEELLLLLDRRRVRVALEQLTDPQRELVELAYYGGLTQRDLAQRLHVPLGTIKSRMSTALARLAVAVA